MRLAAVLLTSMLLAGAAYAQGTAVSPMTGSNGTPNGPATHVPPAAALRPAPASPAATTTAAPRARRRTLAERFDAANTTHDGHLTLEQARAGRMIAVARDFDAIDKQHHGYVTMDDIRDYIRARRAARRAHPAPAATQ